MLLPCLIPLQLLQLPHFVAQQMALVLTLRILVLYKCLELSLADCTSLQLYDLCFRQVNEVRLESIRHQLVVAVVGPLGEREEQSLRDVVLTEEVAAHSAHFITGWRVILREQVTSEWLEVWTLRRVLKTADQHRLLWSIVPQPASELILVDERELRASRVHVHLMHQVICQLRVLDQ